MQQQAAGADRSVQDLGEETRALVECARTTRQPVRITDAGDELAVVLDAREFAALQERLALLEAVFRAESEIAEGRGISHDVARERALAAIAR